MDGCWKARFFPESHATDSRPGCSSLISGIHFFLLLEVLSYNLGGKNGRERGAGEPVDQHCFLGVCTPCTALNRDPPVLKPQATVS